MNPSSDNMQTQANEDHAGSALDNRGRAVIVSGSLRTSADFNHLLTEEHENHDVILEQPDEALEELPEDERDEINQVNHRSPAITQVQPLSSMMMSNSPMPQLNPLDETPQTQIMARDRTLLNTAQATDNNVSAFENIEESKDISPIAI